MFCEIIEALKERIMIYKQCIDACFDATKACDRYGAEGLHDKGCPPGHCHAIIAGEVCTLVGRLTAKGVCHKELFELCAKICEECAEKCKNSDNEHAKDCTVACKKCAETCRVCQEDCKKYEKESVKD